jgi:tRNA(Ile)-lysidine synthase
LIAAIQRLSRARQANVLRYWLRKAYSAVPSTAQMNELLAQIAACTTRGHHIRIKVAQGHVERRDAHLDWYNP